MKAGLAQLRARRECGRSQRDATGTRRNMTSAICGLRAVLAVTLWRVEAGRARMEQITRAGCS